MVGAGDAGGLVLREMLKNRAAGYTPIGLIDDDPRKRHMRLHGVRVLGTTKELSTVLRDRRPDEVHIAIPSAGGDVRNRIVHACRDASVPVKTLPTLPELLNGDADLVQQLREVRVEDVLGREPVHLDQGGVGTYARDVVVMVTGAGGSIGSELCRQLIKVGPKRLILLDNAENNLFLIERELAERGMAGLVPVIADVRDGAQVDRLFAEHRPAVVFHAAAYKHVSLMQANPMEAVRNNALATQTVARAAAAHGVGRFVLVSTDKAVNSQTTMGSSKALAEWVVEAMAQRTDETAFVAVRFGNVLAQLRLGGAHLPAPDRPRRPGDGHPPGDDALLHDHPRGGPADRAGRRHRPRRRDLRPRHGRAGAHPRPGARHDPPLRPGARAGRSHRDRGHPARARSCTRSCSSPGSTSR